MISTLKQRANGRYYCSNCMMLQSDPPKANCFFCGNWFSNYESVIIQEEKDKMRPLMDIEPETGKNKYASNETLVGMRVKTSVIDDSSFISKEEIEKIITEMKVKSNESDIYGRD